MHRDYSAPKRLKDTYSTTRKPWVVSLKKPESTLPTRAWFEEVRDRMREFPKIRGSLFWGPYNKDPIIYDPILGSPSFGNSHVPPRPPKGMQGPGSGRIS